MQGSDQGYINILAENPEGKRPLGKQRVNLLVMFGLYGFPLQTSGDF
jgi:hypothetical protein